MVRILPVHIELPERGALIAGFACQAGSIYSDVLCGSSPSAAYGQIRVSNCTFSVVSALDSQVVRVRLRVMESLRMT